jgi:nucleoside-diphosphate-sugar epimerase
MKFLVTGGCGFIGSNLVKRLLDEGHHVTVVDDMSAGELCFLPKEFDKENLYIQDFASDVILNKIAAKEFDIVMHLAARPRVPYSVEFPYESNDVNVTKTVKLLEACRGNIKRFVNTSSSSVYGNADVLPTHEGCKHDPQSPYALQKDITEQYCQLFSKLYFLQTVSVRPFNVFGPNQRGNNPYATAVGAWFSAIHDGRPLRSDGTGEQSRDVTYVDNVVDIMYRCAMYEGILYGDAFNAGTGFSITNNEILAWFKKTYPGCEIVNAPARKGDVMKTCADISKAQSVLGYKVLVGFWDGVEKTRQWVFSGALDERK